jgi:death-on-curing protein
VDEPVWIREDVVRLIHLRQLAEHGGEQGVRDDGLLSSALARPKNIWAYEGEQCDLARLAAAYAHRIAMNHPFLDGNKRVVYVVSRTFLRLNGCDIEASAAERYVAFYRLAAGRISEAELAAWLREHLRALR